MFLQDYLILLSYVVFILLNFLSRSVEGLGLDGNGKYIDGLVVTDCSFHEWKR